MTPLPSAALAFGKLPAHGDFVRLGAPSRALDAMDAWVQEGMVEARRYGPLPGEEGPTYQFVYVPLSAPDLLVGAFRWSRDRVGRRYPFLVARAVARRDVDPRGAPHWPVVWADLLAAAAGLVEEAVGGLGTADLERRLGRLPLPAEPNDRGRRSAYDEALRRTPVAAFREAVWGAADSGRWFVVFERLLGMLRPPRGVAVPSCGMTFPLPMRHNSATTTVPPSVLPPAVWLDVLWRLLPRPGAGPVLCWPANAGAGAGADVGVAAGCSASLLAFPQPPARHAFARLAGAPPDPRHVVDLDAPSARPIDALLALPARYGRLLEQEHLLLAQLLHAL